MHITTSDHVLFSYLKIVQKHTPSHVMLLVPAQENSRDTFSVWYIQMLESDCRLHCTLTELLLPQSHTFSYELQN